MGLDSVELVLAVEDRFRVALPDAECARVRTVADLASLVMARLPREGCPTALTFYRVRAALVCGPEREGVVGSGTDSHVGQCGQSGTCCSLDRHSLRPSTPIETVFPRGVRRARWKLIEGAPPLRVADGVRRWSWVAVLLALAAWAVLVAWAALHSAGLVASGPGMSGPGVAGGVVLMLMFAVLLAGAAAARQVACEFPPQCRTLGDLARLMSPPVVGQDDAVSVLDEIRAMVATQTGLKVEDVRPESRFVQDLGMG